MVDGTRVEELRRWSPFDVGQTSGLWLRIWRRRSDRIYGRVVSDENVCKEVAQKRTITSRRVSELSRGLQNSGVTMTMAMTMTLVYGAVLLLTEKYTCGFTSRTLADMLNVFRILTRECGRQLPRSVVDIVGELMDWIADLRMEWRRIIRIHWHLSTRHLTCDIFAIRLA